MSSNPTVKSYFKNKSVLITGATGLIGKLIVFKLLITCDIRKIYVLIRSKNNETIDKRFEKFKCQQLFDFLPDSKLLSKIEAIEGDIGDENLGISEANLNEIIANVSIVYHAAASISFYAPLNESVKLNVIGTQSVINLCKSLQNLEAFIHISTAFCNPHQSVCDEIIYESHVKPKDSINLMRFLDSEQIKLITKTYLRQFPNTYTLTKNLAENLIREECTSIPTAILRPSLVSPTIKEPAEGWVDSLNGLSGAILLAAVGIVRTGRIDLNAKADIIPTDIFANICIVATFATAVHYNKEIKVYNSCNLTDVTNQELQRLGYQITNEYPFPMAVRPPAAPQSRISLHPIIHYPTKIFSEICFAFLCDVVLTLFGHKRIILRYIRRVHRVLETVEYFSALTQQHKNHNLLNLQTILNNEEQSIFNFDMKGIDWRKYSIDMYFGSRKYLLKEEEVNLKRDRLRMRMIKAGYGLAESLAIGLICYFLINITSIGNFIEFNVVLILSIIYFTFVIFFK